MSNVEYACRDESADRCKAPWNQPGGPIFWRMQEIQQTAAKVPAGWIDAADLASRSHIRPIEIKARRRHVDE